MNTVRSIVKLVATRAFGVFIVFNIVVWTICQGITVQALLESYGPKHAKFSPSERMGDLPFFAGVGWTRTHFLEFHSLRSRYMSYIGWRREPFQGKTITLEGPYARRATVGSADPGKPSVYFFGGSTMWGMGVDDANTIPSLVARIGGFRSQNYGESGWTAHQSLTLLIQLFQEGHRPDAVVFYDGANDVAHKCRRELTPASHAREHQIRAAVSMTKPQHVYGLQHMLQPLIGLAAQIQRGLSRREGGSCRLPREPTEGAADRRQPSPGLDVARRLVEVLRGRFIGILQPVAYYSDTKLDHVRSATSRRSSSRRSIRASSRRWRDGPASMISRRSGPSRVHLHRLLPRLAQWQPVHCTEPGRSAGEAGIARLHRARRVGG
jgi:hypothetical protein